MAQSGNIPTVFSPVSVIGPQFVASNSFELIVEKFSTGSLVITDIYHRMLFKLKPCDTNFHFQRVLLDPNDIPIVMLREKNMTAHDRWNVFRGESDAESDMIFSAKSKHMIKFKTSIKVFIADRKSSHKNCDFKLKGNWSKKECTIYLGDSSTAIAQMHAVPASEDVKFAKDKFMVTIYQNVDYAFVVALIAVVDAMKSSNEIVGAQVAGAVGEAVGGAVGS